MEITDSQKKERNKQYAKKWRKVHIPSPEQREKYRLAAIEWRNNHPELVAKQNAKYREKNKEKIQIKNHEYYLQNKEKSKESSKKSRLRLKQTNRINIIEFLQKHPCVDCGEKDIIVLEFDHINGNKDFNISQMIKDKSWKNVLKEITKCEVRCANCHRKVTAKRGGSYKLIVDTTILI